MDNQHRQIKGYRDLSQAEIDLMNEVKAHAEKTRELLMKVGQAMDNAYATGTSQAFQDDYQAECNKHESLRWQRIANDHLQQGFMALTRSIALPGTF